jgi:hypothetical protein
MTKLQKIEREIEALSYEELKSLGRWFDELRAQAWDDQIERDAKAGKFDKFAEAALAEHRAGKTRPL